MIEDLTMIATQPVVDAEGAAKAKDEADKAAASETMPPAKRKRAGKQGEPKAARIARRGQDPPASEKTAEEDS